VADALRDLDSRMPHRGVRGESRSGDLTPEMWRDLLSTLDPDAIRGARQGGWGAFGYRALWEDFVGRYQVLRGQLERTPRVPRTSSGWSRDAEPLAVERSRRARRAP
jgi:hypothetical protein